MKFINNTYQYLPVKFHKKHDYCEFVVSQIEELILNKQFIELSEQRFEFPTEFMDKLASDDKHILDLLEENNYNDIAFHIVKNRILLALIMETCYFFQEGLLSSLKMRMTVCFTLFRKPFLEISILLMRILNEADFIDRFNKEDKFDPVLTTPERKKELVLLTNTWLHDKYNPEDIYDLIFNKKYEDSLFNLTNNAVHLHTNRNPISSTGKQNLNFIFSTEEDIERQWEYIYDYFPMLITYMADLIDLLVFKSTSVEEKIFIKRFKERDKLKNKNNVC